PPALALPRAHGLSPHASAAVRNRRPDSGHLAGHLPLVEIPPVVVGGRHICEHASRPAPDSGYFLVLLLGALHWRLAYRGITAHRRRGLHIGADHIHAVRGRLLLRNHAFRHTVGAPGTNQRRARTGFKLHTSHAFHRAATGISQHGAGAAYANHRVVPGHFTGLRTFTHRLPRCRSKSSPARRP